MWKRACKLGCQSALKLGKIKNVKPSLKEQNLHSAAYGQNKFELIPTEGVYQIDLYVWIKREFKLDSYKLDAVAEKYLSEHKLDVTPQEIFKLYTQGPAERRRVAEYCVQVRSVGQACVSRASFSASTHHSSSPRVLERTDCCKVLARYSTSFRRTRSILD